jgi:hypothetical protein
VSAARSVEPPLTRRRRIVQQIGERRASNSTQSALNSVKLLRTSSARIEQYAVQ